MNHDAIASRLKAIRLAKNIGQKEVADHLGLSPSVISRMENGKRRMSVDQLGKWADALGCRSELILWDVEDDDDGADLRAVDRAALSEIAGALPYLPRPALTALLSTVRIWRREARKQPE